MPTTDNVQLPCIPRASNNASDTRLQYLLDARGPGKEHTSHRGGPRVGDRLVQGPHSRHLCSHANAQLPTSGTPSPHFTVTQQAD